MRILSLNAWGGALHEQLVRYLVDADVDVICLQEVSRAPAARSPWLTYRHDDHDLPQRADLYAEVRNALPGHDAFFAPAARGELLDGDTPCWQEFGLATFVRSTFPVIGGAVDFVYEDYRPDGFGEHPRARNAHAVRLFDYDLGRAVTVVQLHGLRDRAGKGDSPARDVQAAGLVEFIGRVRRPGEPFVLCGDLNVLPDSRLFATLAELGLRDLVTGSGFTDTRTSHYTKPVRYADYLLVSPEVQVASFDVVAEPEVSDHRVLLLTID